MAEKTTAAQRNKLDAIRWRKLIAIIDGPAKVDTMAIGDGREITIAKPDYGPATGATLVIH